MMTKFYVLLCCMEDWNFVMAIADMLSLHIVVGKALFDKVGFRNWPVL